jgi:hypothetical protein
MSRQPSDLPNSPIDAGKGSMDTEIPKSEPSRQPIQQTPGQEATVTA